jgi:transposase
MIPVGVQVFIALEPVDMRCGFDRLAGWVRERMGYDVRGGSLFAFVGKRRTTVKVLFFDGTGACTFHKRLDRGSFVLPVPPSDGATHVEVDDGVLETLLDGICVEPTAPKRPRPRRRIH